jgi:hypothetical protein
MAKLLIAALGAVLLQAGCVSGGSEETGESAPDGPTAAVVQRACRKVCGKRCYSTPGGVRCQQQCSTQCW